MILVYDLNGTFPNLGVKVRNMKMDLNIYGTWHWITFEKLMMKIYDFFFIWLSRLVDLYNNTVSYTHLTLPTILLV